MPWEPPQFEYPSTPAAEQKSSLTIRLVGAPLFWDALCVLCFLALFWLMEHDQHMVEWELNALVGAALLAGGVARALRARRGERRDDGGGGWWWGDGGGWGGGDGGGGDGGG